MLPWKVSQVCLDDKTDYAEQGFSRAPLCLAITEWQGYCINMQSFKIIEKLEHGMLKS